MKFIHETIDVFGFLLYQAAFWFYWFSLIIVPLGLPLFGIYLIRKNKKIGIITGKIYFLFSLFLALLWLYPIAHYNIFWIGQILEKNPPEICKFDRELLTWCLWVLVSLGVCYLGMFILGLKGLILKVLGWIALVLGIWGYGFCLVVRLFVDVDLAL